LYAYAGNNPVAFADPFGLNPCKERKYLACAWGMAKELGRMEYRGFVAGADPTGTTQLSGDMGHAGFIAGKLLFAMAAPATTSVSAAATGTRYMGTAEAATVARTRVVPAVNAAGRPRVIHYTTDSPTMSASEAMTRYHLDATPTHMCQFRLCNVLDDVQPTGTVAPEATQAATSRPINGAGRPIPLDP